jgi:hypothetical protein
MKISIPSVVSKFRIYYFAGLALLVFTGVVVAARVVGRRARLQPNAIASAELKVPKPVVRSTAQNAQTTAPGEVELITLTPTGFEPDEITRPTGKFLFGVNNRSRLSDLTFRLLHESGASHGEKRMVREKVWRKVVDLPPGRYLLSVADHPEWRCPITIVRP